MELLTENCRAELHEERERRNILENVTLREYAETIADLEHKVNFLTNNNGRSRSRQKLDGRPHKSIEKVTNEQK